MDFEKTDYHATITKIKSKTPSISGLATSAVLITIENKTPGASNLVKKNNDTKYQILKINILPQRITINLLKILLLIK